MGLDMGLTEAYRSFHIETLIENLILTSLIKALLEKFHLLK